MQTLGELGVPVEKMIGMKQLQHLYSLMNIEECAIIDEMSDMLEEKVRGMGRAGALEVLVKVGALLHIKEVK
jgi:hypothetical protein